MTRKSEPESRKRTRARKRHAEPLAAQSAPPRTGRELVEIMEASPLRDIDIEPARFHLPVRDVKL